MEAGGLEEPRGGELRRRLADAAQDIGFAVGAQGLVSGLMTEGRASDLVGAAAPTMLSLTVTGSVYAYRRWLRRGSRIIEVASTETGQTPEELADAIRGSEANSELFSRVMEAAAATRLEDKIYALGRALAMGVSDPTHLDEAHMLVEALAAIEEPHVDVLRTIQFSIDSIDWDLYERGGHPDAKNLDDLGRTMSRTALENSYPRGHLPLEPAIARLTGAGLIFVPSPGGYGGGTGTSGLFPVGEHYAISPMGKRCVELLREAAAGM
jgi:hypothetical protein